MTPDPTKPTANVLNSATLIMGLSGAGKSSLLATFMEWVWETYGLATLYYCCDGGGFPTQIQALVNRGIARLWRMRTRSGAGLAFETCQRASQGWWPKVINPATGETAPTVQLVPPLTEKFEMRCPNDHIVKVVPAQSLLTGSVCPTCKVPVTPQNMKVTRTSHRTKGFEKVGAAAFDGLSSMCSWMMDDLSKRDLGGEKSRLGGTVMSGELMFGENNRAQVGFTQNRAEQLALNALGIPFLVAPPIWTALVQEGSDEGNLAIRGPMIAGQAKTAVAPQWFGNCLEAIVVEHDGKRYRRLNLAEYIDSGNVRHLCKVRSFPGMLPAYLEDEDTGDGQGAFVNFNLGTFHKLLDAALIKTEDQYAQRFADSPGLQAGEMTYGEDVQAPAAPTVAAGMAPGPRPGVPAGVAGPPAIPVAPPPRPAQAPPVTPSTAPATHAQRPPVVAQPQAAPPATPVVKPLSGPTPPPAAKPPARGPVPPPAGRKPPVK